MNVSSMGSPMDADDIRREWDDEHHIDIKEEILSEPEDENSDHRTAEDEANEKSQIQTTFATEENSLFDHKVEVDDEFCHTSHYHQTNYLNFADRDLHTAVISETTENEILVTEDPDVASEIFIDENDVVEVDKITKSSRKKQKWKGRSYAFSLFSITEDTKRIPRESEGLNGAKPEVYVDEQKRAKEKCFECALCERTFICKRNLRSHISMHTFGSEFKCKICGVNFRSKNDLNRHFKNHRDKAFKCDLCKATFSKKRGLDAHLRKHAPDRPHVCTICHLRFKRKHVLNTHMLVHLDTDSKFKASFNCELCSESFTRKSQLQKHVRDHAYQQYNFSLSHINRP